MKLSVSASVLRLWTCQSLGGEQRANHSAIRQFLMQVLRDLSFAKRGQYVSSCMLSFDEGIKTTGWDFRQMFAF